MPMMHPTCLTRSGGHRISLPCTEPWDPALLWLQKGLKGFLPTPASTTSHAAAGLKSMGRGAAMPAWPQRLVGCDSSTEMGDGGHWVPLTG